MRRDLATLAIIACLAPITSVAEPVPLSGADPDVGNWLVEPVTNQTWGWAFTTLEPLVVTNVGWYDENRDGLSHEHFIGLWAGYPFSGPPPTQLLEGNNGPFGILIPGGTTAQLDGPWRKVALPYGTFTLPIGDYILGGTNSVGSSDHVKYTFDSSVKQLDPRVTRAFVCFSRNEGFNLPDQFTLTNGVQFGPMLFVLPVPEPSTCGLTTIAAALLITHSFRSRARKTSPSAH